MRIDFLYFADCPSHEEALARLREALEQEGLTAEIAITEVTSDEAARDLRFVGSPTIRIDGVDIDSALDESQGFGLACRGYRRPDGRITPLPPLDLIRAALHRAARR